MAVPSRIFVGITLFGLMATLATATFAVMVLTGYTSPPSSPADDPRPFSVGTKIFLVLATLFSGAFTLLSWQSLVAGARRDRQRKANRAGSAGRRAGAPSSRANTPASAGNAAAQTGQDAHGNSDAREAGPEGGSESDGEGKGTAPGKEESRKTDGKDAPEDKDGWKEPPAGYR